MNATLLSNQGQIEISNFNGSSEPLVLENILNHGIGLPRNIQRLYLPLNVYYNELTIGDDPIAIPIALVCEDRIPVAIRQTAARIFSSMGLPSLFDLELLGSCQLEWLTAEQRTYFKQVFVFGLTPKPSNLRVVVSHEPITDSPLQNTLKDFAVDYGSASYLSLLHSAIQSKMR